MSEFKPVLLALPSLTPSLALEILPHGLTLHHIFVQADGRTHDLVIGPEAPQDHLSQKYTNTVVGRYANRIPVGTHSLERNGIKSEFTAIANENPRVSLHGGPTGFDSLTWDLVTTSTLFTPVELSHIPKAPSATSHAIFRLVSSDGDQGYPGKLVVEALVALVAPGEQVRKYRIPGQVVEGDGEEYDLGSIVVVYRAKLEDERRIVTPINLTQHWGFNLDASLKEGPESLSVKDHTLTIGADRIVERDAESIATGSFLSTAGNPTHAHAAKRIGDGFPEGGYDDFYVFRAPSVAQSSIPAATRIPLTTFTPELDLLKDILRPSNDAASQGRGARADPVVELASQKSGLNLVFDTNQSGVMFYSNNFADTSGARKKIHGGSGIKGQGDGYGPGTAAFLEFHEPLTAFLDPNNKNGADTLLTSEEVYHNYVRVDVKFKEPRR